MRIAIRSLAIAVLASPTLAFAHEGHDHGFVSAFAHPFTGWDHLLAMLLVGVLAARYAGRAAMALPAAFVGGAALGAVGGLALSAAGAPAWLEPAIAGSVMLLGLAAAITARVPVVVATLACIAFGAVHGVAHGIELDSASAAPVLAGMLLATALLHGAGYAAARSITLRSPLALRVAALASSAVAAVALLRLA